MAKKAGSRSSKPKPVEAIDPSEFSADDGFTGFDSTDDEKNVALESSDEEDEDVETKAVVDSKAIKELGKLAKKKLAEAGDSQDTKATTGVVYVGRIPHGFYEREMRQYFGQFGSIKNLRLSRNKRTGASKHFAFVEFESAKVADIVVDTMDNYLIFGHILKVKRVEPAQVHEKLFEGANKPFKPVAWGERGVRRYKSKHGREFWESHAKSDSERRKARAQKLKELGIKYDLP